MREKYAYTICNYLNNLKGTIEKYEIVNLMWCIFGESEEDLNTNLIDLNDILKLSADVATDSQEQFYEDLKKLYVKIGGENER